MDEFKTNEELIYALIIDDLDGSITPENKSILQQWRNADVVNEHTYQDFVNVQLSIDQLYEQKGYHADASWAALESKIDAIPTASAPAKKLLFSSNWYKIAAAVLVVLSIGYYFSLSNKYVEITTEPTVASTKIVLPDGTEVNLNAATTIKYNKKDFMSDRNLILQKGEVFIHVVKHDGPQFTVDLGDVQARDIGTRFNINRNERDVAVIVEDGEVALKHNSLEQGVMLTKGKKGIYDAKTGTLVTVDNADLNYKAWIDKKFTFMEVPFAQVADQLQKVYLIPIRINGEELKGRKLTAKLQYQTLDSVLAVISASLQCKVAKDMNTYVLSDN